MILKHNFTEKALAQLKNQRLNQKKKIKEDRELAEYNDAMQEDDYVGYEAAINEALAKQVVADKNVGKTTQWVAGTDYILGLGIGFSIGLFVLASYIAWFK
jgi:hypothetical protein